MASVREVSGITEDLLCPICLSVFQEPRMLGCGHNFCLACLESCVIAKGRHEGLCPECRRPFSLQDAVPNRVLANLAEKVQLLKLERVTPSGGPGSWYFCEEHEEPLKLFCSEDEAPVCVICRDLPQHQGHRFLPIQNAVKDCQGKLKASLKPLEDGVKWATSNQSRQQEEMQELESLSEHLCGLIFIECENLRQILNAKEQDMMDTVKQLKQDNQAEMERRLEYLQAYESSHAETISRVRTALEEPNEFALLKGIKELMGRIHGRLQEGDGEAEPEVCAHDQGAKKTEVKDVEDGEVDVDVLEEKGDETKSDEGEAFEEARDAEEAEERGIVLVDPAVRELEEWLVFDTWKEMLESISIGETYPPGVLYSPSPEEDMFQLGDGNTSEATEEEAASPEEGLSCAVDVLTSGPDEAASDKPLPTSSSDAAKGRAFHSQPPILSTPNYFPVPFFQQIPLYNSVQRWSACSWRPRAEGRGAPVRQFFRSRRGQGRVFPNTQTPQHVGGSWRLPATFNPRAGASGEGRGWFHQQKPQSSWSSTSGQSSGGKTDSPVPRGAHVSGQRGSRQSHGSTPQPNRGGSGRTRGSSPQPNRGGPGHGRGSAQRGPTHHHSGQAPSGKGPCTRPAPHRGGGGRGSGSAKGSRTK